MHSTNGTFMDGRLINKIRLHERATIQCGQRGPVLSLRIEKVGISTAPILSNNLLGTVIKSIPASTQVFRNYFSKSLPQNAGHFTMNMHRAFNQAVRKRSKCFLLSLAVVGTIAAGALAMAWWQHWRYNQIKPLGVEIFYTMKTLELQINGLIDVLSKSSDPEIAREIEAMEAQYDKLQGEYDNFVEKLGIYDEDIPEQERLILRVARVFGECEINAPPDFVNEVNRYIEKWRTSDRLENAIRRSIAHSYHKTIAEKFLDHHLPPQFIYLALQESGFDLNVCGPKTRYGIAKGMWQFIPRTAAAYGLKLGPLLGVRKPDPRDERHDFEKSTAAAARLIHDLYNTRAQGSGLLVLASYNWGIGNLLNVINRMPPNPKERNFWNLVQNHSIPQQTYDFVFYIISAAVIGENPELFGFDFENILEDVS